MEAAQVTREIARVFMDEEADQKMAAKTWNDSLKRMKAIFKFLQVEYGVLRNPFDGIKAHEEHHVDRRPLTMAEVKALLDAVKDDEFCRPIIVCGLSTAMRRGDCCLLKWADKDADKAYEADAGLGELREMALKTREGMTGKTPSATRRAGREKQIAQVMARIRKAKKWVDGRILGEVPAMA